MQISPKLLTVAFITAMTVAFLLFLKMGHGLQAVEAASPPRRFQVLIT